MRVIHVLRLLALLLVLVAASAHSQERDGVEKNKAKSAAAARTAKQDQRGTEQSPLVIRGIPTERSEEQARYEHYEHAEKPINERLTSWATVILAIVTTGLAYFTWRLWSATRRLVEDAEETARRQLRAYLGVSGGEIKILNPNHLQANVEIKNTGSTPAHHVTKAINADIRDADNPGGFEIPKAAPGKWPIVPGSFWTFRLDLTNVSEEDLKQIHAYKRAVFVWGRAEYEDIFGVKQTLEFRYRNMAKRLVWTEGTGFGGVQIVKPFWATVGWDLHPEEEGNSST